jgi:hypothetical protein
MAWEGIVTCALGLRFVRPLGSQGSEENQLQRVSVPARDHSVGALALPPVRVSFRDVEDLLAERGIAVSYETVRRLNATWNFACEFNISLSH